MKNPLHYPVSVCTIAVMSCLLSAPGVRAQLTTTHIPRYDAAVASAVSYLNSLPRVGSPHESIVAYALLKAGVDKTAPRLAQGIAVAKRRATAAEYDQYHGEYLVDAGSHVNPIDCYVAAVDAMLLVDAENEAARPELQKIADLISAYQRSDGSWSDPATGPQGPADVSLMQYSILGLWAAQRAGCNINPRVIDKAAAFLARNSNSDGGWPYRPGTSEGPESGASSHTMTIGAVGSLAICRFLLYGVVRKETGTGLRFGVLETVENGTGVGMFHRYQPELKLNRLNRSIERGVRWNRVRFEPVPPTIHVGYFYYALERAAAFEPVRNDWYTTYGDALLEQQEPEGFFESSHHAYGPEVETSFAILYFMRSTQQILQYGRGLTRGYRDLKAFVYGDPSGKKKELAPLDALLEKMAEIDVGAIDVDTEEVVEKIKYSSREELIGHTDKLRVMLKSPDASDRQIAYWALSRTSDFELIPLMLDGLHDPDLSVSIEALTGLRYIARKPKGFDLSLQPLSRLPADADESTKLNAAQVWKDKASRLWRKWYSGVRPYAERDGLDEIRLPVDGTDR